MAITADQIKQFTQTMFGGKPQNPLYPNPPAPDPSQAAQPQTSAPLASNPPQPTPQTEPSAPIQPGQIGAAFNPPQSKTDYLAANPVALPARPRGDFDKIPEGQPGADSWGNRHNVMRQALASLFAGAAEFGGDINHHPGAAAPFINRWAGQTDAQRAYDQNQPVIKQQAENQQYSTALEQQGKGAEIGKAEADTGLIKAQTGNLAMNPPGKAEFLKELQTRRASGKDDPQQLFNEYAVRAPYAHTTRQEILDVIKNTPVQPFNFDVKEGAIQPGSYLGHTYGPDATGEEPPEIGAARKNALGTISQGQKGKIAVATAEAKAKNAINLGSFGQAGDPMIDMVGQGRVDLQSVLQRIPPQGKEAFMTQLNAKYPDFQQSTYGVGKNVSEAFTAGPQGQQLTAINTAREHMKTFGQLADALKNNNVQVLNKIGNAFGVQFGNDQATNFRIASQAFGGEVGKALAGAGVTEGERKQAEGSFSPNMSPEQFRGAIQTVDKLLAGKQKSLQQSYDAGRQGKPNFGGAGGGGGNPTANDPLGIR